MSSVCILVSFLPYKNKLDVNALFYFLFTFKGEILKSVKVYERNRVGKYIKLNGQVWLINPDKLIGNKSDDLNSCVICSVIQIRYQGKDKNVLGIPQYNCKPCRAYLKWFLWVHKGVYKNQKCIFPVVYIILLSS